MDLILASTSAYRRALLERLRINFRCVAPQVDETPLPGERPAPLASRLALAKARAVAGANPEALVIGSDQVAELDGQVLGKPGDAARAAAQLRASSGREVRFHTGVALVRESDGFEALAVEPFRVRFRELDDAEIGRYLALDEPFDCAGSFKSESLGIALFESLEGDDPTALEGLPLIRLCAQLRRAGLAVP